jgi:hypothetical protein
MSAELAKDFIAIHGFSRVQIVNDDGSLYGDSGYVGPNNVVDLGFNHYLVSALGSIAGSKYITHAALGTGTQPGNANTDLQGELVGTGVSRAAITAATSNTSKTLRCTATFSSANSFTTGTSNISNIGLFNTNAGGSLFCGNTFASSSCATNQNVNVTYDIVFS